jgi:hypothetical protein
MMSVGESVLVPRKQRPPTSISAARTTSESPSILTMAASRAAVKRKTDRC